MASRRRSTTTERRLIVALCDEASTTVSPTTPLVGLMLVLASGITKFAALSAVPAIVVTATFPVVAPGGTVA